MAVYRLIKVAKEIGVGKDTCVEHLESKGFEVDNNPNAKLTQEMYDELLRKFSGDRALRERADKIAIGQNKREELKLDAEGVVQAIPIEAEEEEAAEATPPPPAEVKEEEPAKEEEEVATVEEPVAETVEEAKEEIVEEKPKEEVVVAKEEEVVAVAVEEEVKEEKKEVKEGKGPKVIGKIDLEEVKAKAKPAKKKKAEKKEEVEPKKEEKVAKKPEPAKKVERPKKEEKKENFIKTEKRTLDGPKVIGKIELPVEQPKKSKKDKEKEQPKKRKRTRVVKKTGRVSIEKEGRRAGKRGDRRRGGKKDEPQQEVSEKEIQDKIKATMAKLSGGASKKSSRSKLRKQKRETAAQVAAENAENEQSNLLEVTEFVSVNELASLMDVSVTQVISACMSLGTIVSINQRLDAEIIELVADEFNFEVKFIDVSEQEEEEEEIVDAEEDLQERPPIVTIMGHVDHGKTSLLDYIRNANVIAGEVGGITQHIGAYEVTTEGGKKITFLDTPGHEAFTAMRARGAKVTDIAVIVVAADDAIMPQTKEAISHAQAAGVPIIFAINKVDKDTANPEKIKEQLAAMNFLVEDWGGKYQSEDISAKTGLKVDSLLEKILLEAELLELKANPDRNAVGTVIEASLDKGRGYVSTVLVQTGTMRVGDVIVSGSHYGKVKAMFNERGAKAKEAGPSTPVIMLGLSGAPQAGEKFKIYDSEQDAKAKASKREQIEREQGIRTQKHITLDEIGRRLALGNFKELNLIVKGDVDGSVEALSDSLLKLSTEEIQINVIHKSVGQITESDVLLATASDAIIIGFQVRPSLNARKLAEKEDIDIRQYSIIYNAIEEIKMAMEGMLEPTIEEKIVCNVEIREIFKVSKVGTIAGCYVMDGKISRDTKIRLIREGIVVYSGVLDSLKRFKDDVKEVTHGMECGLAIKNYNDIKIGDIIEGYTEVEIKRTLK